MQNITKAIGSISEKDKKEFYLYYLEKVVPAEILEFMIKKNEDE